MAVDRKTLGTLKTLDGDDAGARRACLEQLRDGTLPFACFDACLRDFTTVGASRLTHRR